MDSSLLEDGINLILFPYISLIFVAFGAPQMVLFSLPIRPLYTKLQFILFKIRTWGQFAPSFGCPILGKLSASGGFAPWPPDHWPLTRGSAPGPHWGLCPRFHYTLALRTRHGQGPLHFFIHVYAYASVPLCCTRKSHYCSNFNQILHSNKDFQALFVDYPKMCPTNPWWPTANIVKKKW